MSTLRAWRLSRGWSQGDLGSRLGIRSKGQISRLEKGVGVTTDIAIAIDRLTSGEVPVAALRPDLHDVRVLQLEGAA